MLCNFMVLWCVRTLWDSLVLQPQLIQTGAGWRQWRAFGFLCYRPMKGSLGSVFLWGQPRACDLAKAPLIPVGYTAGGNTQSVHLLKQMFGNSLKGIFQLSEGAIPGEDPGRANVL